MKKITVGQKRAQYVNKRIKQLKDMGFSEKEILGRAKDSSSFSERKRNYDTFLKRANQMAKSFRQERKETINRIENKAKQEIAKIDKSKITPITGRKGAVFNQDFVERLIVADIRAKAYIEELRSKEYDKDTKYYLENYSSVLEDYDTKLKDYDMKHADRRLKSLERYNIDIVQQKIQGERDFIEGVFLGGKMELIEPKLRKEVQKAIQTSTVKQLNELYKSYSREQIIEDYQDWKMPDNPVYSKTDLENKARWFIGKLMGE